MLHAQDFALKIKLPSTLYHLLFLLAIDWMSISLSHYFLYLKMVNISNSL